jgi:hypothetical protein
LVYGEKFFELQNELMINPSIGKIVKGTGGARKIRMKLKNSGKSGVDPANASIMESLRKLRMMLEQEGIKI